MRVKVLGSAAGGGFPQWNCGCSNCRRLRLGTLRATPRSQAQVAVTCDDQHWFLLGASPDLRYQIEGFQDLHPRGEGRHSPIAGVVLTGGDMDHTLGLLLLREWHRLHVYSTATVQRVLLHTNTIFRLLERMPDQLRWMTPLPGSPFELTAPDGAASGITARLLALPGGMPAYAPPQADNGPGDAVSALILTAPSGKRLAYLPGLPDLSPALLAELQGCHTILVDGTFWSDDELVRMEGFGKMARDIGHLPVSGEGGSLSLLGNLPGVRRIYVHVNNTNPMLDEDSPEHALIREHGWELAFDGMELSL